MTEKGFLGDMCERKIERWTQSSSFLNAFTRRALNSPRFVRAVAKFIHKILKDQVEDIEKKKRMTDDP